MFAGIVETTQPVLSARTEGACKRVRVQNPTRWKLRVGESISVDGICSTVVAIGMRYFDVDYMPETLSKTTAAAFQKHTAVNLERSLRYGDRIHGHVVMGHVDARARVVDIKVQGTARLVTFSLPLRLSKLLVPRGSVAVNGASLTVARTARGAFTVALIPHTLASTNLGAIEVGGRVNIECDAMARYGLAAMRRGATVRVHAKGGRNIRAR